MADCSPSSASQSVLQILHNLQSLGHCADLDLCGVDESISSFFDRILALFLREMYSRRDVLPFPALIANRRSVDLFRLFSVVQEKGGYSSVDKRRSGWSEVAKEVEFEPELGSAVKIVFFKYLSLLELWLERVPGRQVRRDDNSVRLGAGFDKEEVRDPKKEDDQVTPRSGLKKQQFLSPVRGMGRRLQLENWESGDRSSEGSFNCVKVEGNGSVSCNKRKRDENVVLLEWIRKVAKNPTDGSLAELVSPDKSKVKSQVGKDFFSQIVRVRKAMFQNISRGILESHNQRGARFESSVANGVHYLHEPNQQSTPGSNAKHINGLLAARTENSDVKQKLRSSSFNFDQVADWLFGDQYRVRIPVGPHFQAIVPDWTGKPSPPQADSDELQWLGTRIWPCESNEKKILLNCNPIGRGRSDNCQCKQPGSVECTKFHIAEQRLKLSRELGPAFYAWGFDSMGEEVALSWTEDEEQKFKAIVRLYRPSLNKNFWDQLPLCFPSKGRRKLASYYYNVFLLRRRSYQNRATPNMIESDDDEDSESGFLSAVPSRDS